MQGYRALSQAREYSQAGMQPIRLSETLAYMKIARVRPGDHAARFLRLIQAMDAVHLEWWVKKNKN